MGCACIVCAICIILIQQSRPSPSPSPLRPVVPDDQPFVRVTANISNVRSDGFYNFDSIEVQLDPPISDFYESFNGMIWGVTLFDGFLAQFSAVLPPVIEPNPQVRSVG